MTAVAPTSPPSPVDRLAASLGWTAGQVWTVALGLALAVPAGILGLGPALDGAVSAPAAVAAPAPSSAPAGTAASTPDATPEVGTEPSVPTILDGGPPIGSGGGREGTGPRPVHAPAVERAGPPPPVVAPGGPTTVAGPGEVRAIAAAADAVALAIDRGPDAAGAVVVVDGAGDATTVDLVADGVVHHGAGGVAVSEEGVVVATTSPAAVLLIDPVPGTVEVVAGVPDLPTCIPLAREGTCQPGIVDAAPEPAHLAVDDDGAIYVADRAQACLFRVDGGQAAPWLCDIDFLPSPASGISGLHGVDAADGRLLLTARATLDGRDVVEEVVVGDGTPAGRRRLADLDPTDEVAGVAVLGDGRVAVALTGPGALLVIAPDGAGGERRVTGFERPVDVAVRADDVLVAERSRDAAGSFSSRPASEL